MPVGLPSSPIMEESPRVKVIDPLCLFPPVYIGAELFLFVPPSHKGNAVEWIKLHRIFLLFGSCALSQLKLREFLKTH